MSSRILEGAFDEDDDDDVEALLSQRRPKQQNREALRQELLEAASTPWRSTAAASLRALGSLAGDGVSPSGLSAIASRERVALVGEQRAAFDIRKGAPAPSTPLASLDAHATVLGLLMALMVTTAVWYNSLETATTAAVCLLVAATTVVPLLLAWRQQSLLANTSYPTCITVRRPGASFYRVTADSLALGDVIVLRPGDIVPVDARLVSSRSLIVDESPLASASTTSSSKTPRRRHLKAVLKDASANLGMCARVRQSRRANSAATTTEPSEPSEAEQTSVRTALAVAAAGPNSSPIMSRSTSVSMGSPPLPSRQDSTGSPPPLSTATRGGPVEQLLKEFVMVYAGSVVTSGTGEAVVTATGTHTTYASRMVGRSWSFPKNHVSFSSSASNHNVQQQQQPHRNQSVLTGLARYALSSSTRTTSEGPSALLYNTVHRATVYVTAVGLIVATVTPLVLLARGLRDGRELVPTTLSLVAATIAHLFPLALALSVSFCSLSLCTDFSLYHHATELVGSITTIVTNKNGTLSRNQLRLVGAIDGTGHASTASSSSTSTSSSSLETLFSTWLLSFGADHQLRPSANDSQQSTASVNDTLEQDPHGVGAMRLMAALRHADNLFDTTLTDVGPGHPWSRPLCLSAHAIAPLRPRLTQQLPFDDARKVVVQRVLLTGDRSTGDRAILICRGAPETILRVCSTSMRSPCHHHHGTPSGNGSGAPLDDATVARLEASFSEYARSGRRVIAFAALRRDPLADMSSTADPSTLLERIQLAFDEWGVDERQFELAGFAAFEDPLRGGVGEAVQTCRNAGIRVIMATGDSLDTSIAVGTMARLSDEDDEFGGAFRLAHSLDDHDTSPADLLFHTAAFARVDASARRRLVSMLQDAGECVAVLGAQPADVAAMAQGNFAAVMGRDEDAAVGHVALHTASMSVHDANFATFIEAIRLGRVMLSNLRKAITFLLVVKLAVALLFLASSAFYGSPSLSPVQMVLVLLCADTAALFVLLHEPPEADVMQQPPMTHLQQLKQQHKQRSQQQPVRDGPTIFTTHLAIRVVVHAIIVFATTLGASLTARHLSRKAVPALAPNDADTAATFCTLVLNIVFLCFHLRSERIPVLRHGLTVNRRFLLWATVSLLSLALLLSVVPIAQLVHLPVSALIACVIFALFDVSCAELYKWYGVLRGCSGSLTSAGARFLRSRAKRKKARLGGSELAQGGGATSLMRQMRRTMASSDEASGSLLSQRESVEELE